MKKTTTITKLYPQLTCRNFKQFSERFPHQSGFNRLNNFIKVYTKNIPFVIIGKQIIFQNNYYKLPSWMLVFLNSLALGYPVDIAIQMAIKPFRNRAEATNFIKQSRF